MAAKAGTKKLTTRESKFIAALLADPAQNATKAAIKAGYSPKTARQIGSRLLTKAHIAKRRAEKVDELAGEYDTSAKWVINELAKITRCDPRKFFHSDGSVRDIAEVDDECAAGLAGFEAVELFVGSQGDQKHVTGLVKRIKLTDRIRALELIGKYRAMWKDKLEHSGRVTLEDLVCGDRMIETMKRARSRIGRHPELVPADLADEFTAGSPTGRRCGCIAGKKASHVRATHAILEIALVVSITPFSAARFYRAKMRSPTFFEPPVSRCSVPSMIGTLAEAKRLIEAWRQEYNESRPHRSLGERTPSEFASQRPTLGLVQENWSNQLRNSCATLTHPTAQKIGHASHAWHASASEASADRAWRHAHTAQPATFSMVYGRVEDWRGVP